MEISNLLILSEDWNLGGQYICQRTIFLFRFLEEKRSVNGIRAEVFSKVQGTQRLLKTEVEEGSLRFEGGDGVCGFLGKTQRGS